MEEGLHARDVLCRHNKDALDNIREVSLRGVSHHQVLKMSSDSLRGPSCPSVICKPWLSDSGVGRLEFPDKGEDNQAIYNHGQGIYLGHTLLYVKEVTRNVISPDHECVPVAVPIQCKPRTTGPLVAHLPHHGCVVLLI